jgi:hypothetical protein
MAALSPVRAAFLDCAALARDLLARAEVAARWDEPSALASFSVRGLAGHLARGVTTAQGFLDAEPPRPADPVVDAVGYFVGALETDDLESPLHQAIRDRGEEQSADGPVALVRLVGDATAALTDRLRVEPPERMIASRGGAAMLLDEYLTTRVVELVVHIDDLAVSVGVDGVDGVDGVNGVIAPAAAVTIATECCWELARRRHGDRAVLTALTRRERDLVNALKIF